MKLAVPLHLTGEEARAAMHVIEAIVDALIDLHAQMEVLYEPWGEDLDVDRPAFGSLKDFLGLISRPVHNYADLEDR